MRSIESYCWRMRMTYNLTSVDSSLPLRYSSELTFKTHLSCQASGQQCSSFTFQAIRSYTRFSLMFVLFLTASSSYKWCFFSRPSFSFQMNNPSFFALSAAKLQFWMQDSCNLTWHRWPSQNQSLVDLFSWTPN